MYNHLVLRPPRKLLEPERIEPISNTLRLNDVDVGEMQKLVKFGLDMISRGKCNIRCSISPL